MEGSAKDPLILMPGPPFPKSAVPGTCIANQLIHVRGVLDRGVVNPAHAGDGSRIEDPGYLALDETRGLLEHVLRL